MTNKLTFNIPGAPKAQARPRFSVIKSKKTGKSHAVAFDPKESKDHKNWIRFCATDAMKICGWQYTEKALVVEIEAYFEIPKSKTNKFKQQALEGNILPVVKPDLDNIAKGVLDALNTVVFKDDSQIVELTVRKFYNDEPYTKVNIQEWENTENA